MVVIYEFFDKSPIENVITCMHYKVDKVVFFGYKDVINERKHSTEKFLKEECHVKEVVFYELSQSNLKSVLNTMRDSIQKELKERSNIYFDITGGESLILVAFGMLSKELETSMHMFDVVKDKLIELNEGAESSISKEVTQQNVKLTLERHIMLMGGIINYAKQKNIKENNGIEFIQDVAKIGRVASRHIEYWNHFSGFLSSVMIPDDNLRVRKSAAEVIQALNTSKTRIKKVNQLNVMVDELAGEGILLNVVHTGGEYSFRYKNQNVKDCLWEGGSFLELMTYYEEKETSDECKVGVHLDWDGVIEPQNGIDVLNEIDVLSVRGNVVYFISCKSGRMDSHDTLHALYELDTVAGRFGGKYAKKVLVTAKELGEVYTERAAEMGIEIRCMSGNE